MSTFLRELNLAKFEDAFREIVGLDDLYDVLEFVDEEADLQPLVDKHRMKPTQKRLLWLRIESMREQMHVERVREEMRQASRERVEVGMIAQSSSDVSLRSGGARSRRPSMEADLRTSNSVLSILKAKLSRRPSLASTAASRTSSPSRRGSLSSAASSEADREYDQHQFPSLSSRGSLSSHESGVSFQKSSGILNMLKAKLRRPSLASPSSQSLSSPSLKSLSSRSSPSNQSLSSPSLRHAGIATSEDDQPQIASLSSHCSLSSRASLTSQESCIEAAAVPERRGKRVMTTPGRVEQVDPKQSSSILNMLKTKLRRPSRASKKDGSLTSAARSHSGSPLRQASIAAGDSRCSLSSHESISSRRSVVSLPSEDVDSSETGHVANLGRDFLSSHKGLSLQSPERRRSLSRRMSDAQRLDENPLSSARYLSSTTSLASLASCSRSTACDSNRRDSMLRRAAAPLSELQKTDEGPCSPDERRKRWLEAMERDDELCGAKSGA